MYTFFDLGSIFSKMKKSIILSLVVIFFLNSYALAEEKKSFFKPWGSNKNPTISSNSNSTISSISNDTLKKKKRFLNPWGSNKSSKKKENSTTRQESKTFRKAISSNDKLHNISLYTGTFDTIDKEGDDKTTLMGIEHKNEDLFRNTWIGSFSPTSGGFITGKNSIYLYSGIETEYNLGPINITPSFAPGYYEAGNGKNLGSALEFKSEIKIGLDLFKDSKRGYSYSHISNNDWGSVNPGVDNQAVTFSKNF